jgi:hypothetical protein
MVSAKKAVIHLRLFVKEKRRNVGMANVTRFALVRKVPKNVTTELAEKVANLLI